MALFHTEAQKILTVDQVIIVPVVSPHGSVLPDVVQIGRRPQQDLIFLVQSLRRCQGIKEGSAHFFHPSRMGRIIVETGPDAPDQAHLDVQHLF